MKHINLYLAEFRPPAVVLPAPLILQLAGGFLILLVLFHLWQRWDLEQLQARESALTAQAGQVQAQAEAARAAARQADPRLVREAEIWERRLETMQRAQQVLEQGGAGSEQGFSAAFRALAQAATPGAWLTGATLLGQGREMSLKGRALTGEDAARLVASLQRQPRFAGLNFAGLEMESPAGKSPVRASAQVTPQGPPVHLEFELKARLPDSATVTPGTPGASGSPSLHANPPGEPPLAAILGPSSPDSPLPPGLAKLPIPQVKSP